MVLLARAWRFQPSEIEALTLSDFEAWVRQAIEDARRAQGRA